MPGNEVGDRIHNFFGQDDLSRGQQHSHVIDGTWPGLSNNPLAGSPRQTAAHPFFSLKNNNIQQSVDPERERGGQASRVQHGLNFSHSNLGPEFARHQSQSQQPSFNGYMHGHQVFQTKQTEANFLGSEFDRHPVISELANGPELRKNSVTMDFPESPVNNEFFRGPQQTNSQHTGMLQSLSRQQSGFGDKQILQQQQQLMLNQMQELQRNQQLHKQQFQHQEARTLNSINQVNTFAKQVAVGQPMSLINGFPVQDTSNNSLQHEALTLNTNWLQCGSSQAMQGSFNGQMFSPEQGQASHLIGMVPQQVDQSLHGVPISGTRITLNQTSPIQIDKPMTQQMPGSSSVMGNQFTGVPDQASMQDGIIVSRQGYQGKNMIGTADGQGLNSGFNIDNLQQVNSQFNNGSMQEFHGRQVLAGPSETVQEKIVVQVTHSQNVATLDPTEEKILFGSDDNLWEAFGKGTNMGAGGYNILDGADVLGAFPSMQSGSWSALMQSAVAEISSSDVGPQEEWSGVCFQNREPPAGNQQTVSESGRKQLAWVDNSLQASTQNSRPFPLTDETNARMNYNLIGVQQSGVGALHEESEQLQTGSPCRLTQQLSPDRAKWLDRSLLQQAVSEGTHAYGKFIHSSNAESIAKSVSGSWTNQQSVSSYNTRGQPRGRPIGSNFIDSVSPSTTPTLKNQGNVNSLHFSQSADQKSLLIEEMSRGTGIWKTDSISKSVFDLERAKSAIQFPQINVEDAFKNNGVLLDSSIMRANQGSSQQLLNSSNIDVWKNVDSSVNPKEGEIPGKYRPYLDERNSNLESSVSNSLDNSAYEVQNSSIKENTPERGQNVSHHDSTMGVGGNVWLDSSDLCNLSGEKQNSSSHIGRKPSGVRKFQYHPMGDVVMDPSYGAKHVANSQPMFQVSHGLRGHGQRYVGQSKFPSHISEMKGPVDEIPSKSMFLGSAPSSSAPSDRAVHNCVPNNRISSRQNMLELLHKVDQSREHGSAMQLSSSVHNQSSEMSEAETSDGSVHPQQNQSAAAQGFGLQLAPPAQHSPVPDHATSSQSPSHTINFHSSAHITTDKREKGHTWLASAASEQSQSIPPSSQTSLGHSGDNISGASGKIITNVQGNGSTAFPPGFPYSRSHLQNQHVTDAGGQARTTQSPNVSFDTFASMSKQMNESFDRAKTDQLAIASLPASNASHIDLTSATEMSQPSIYKLKAARNSAQQFPVLEAVPEPVRYDISAMSQEDSASKKSPTVLTTVPMQHHPSSAQPFKIPSSIFKLNFQSKNNSETACCRPQKLEDRNAQKGGNSPAESGAFSMNLHRFVEKEQPEKGVPLQLVSPGNDPALKTMVASQGEELAVCLGAAASLPEPASTQKEIEAFGRSLRPSNALNQHYSLLHQVEGMKNTEVNSGHKGLKRFKSPDDAVDSQRAGSPAGQQFYTHNALVSNASTNCSSISPGDAAMLSFSAKPTDDQDPSCPSQDVLAFGQNYCQSSVRGVHTEISPQMAPSWFGQYGTLKNGRILALHDIRKAAIMKKTELPFAVEGSDNAHSSKEQGNAFAADVSQHSISYKNSFSTSLASENLSTPQLLCADAAVRLKKRRTATSKLVPCHKYLVKGPQRLQNISAAEVYWAYTANRLTEKVEGEAEMVDDGPPLHRSKRRLILTTQLMQLLLCPPLASIFSADAFSHYGSTVYSVSRSTLGDACSSLSCARNVTSIHSGSGNFQHDKFQSLGRVSNQYFLKVMEDLINKARKVESDLLRLDKSVSILDLRVECQDLEKFSIINRFAKFHGRAIETLSPYSHANAPKPCPERYVSALSMPRNLPDGVQCLSL